MRQDAETDLQKQTRAASVLLANFRDVIGEDEDLLHDTLDGETNLFEQIGTVENIIADEEFHVKSIDEHIKALQARKSRKKRKIERLRTAILSALELAEVKSFETPTATLTIKPVPPKPVITDEALIPSEFWKVPDPTLDKSALNAALKENQIIPGAELSNGGQTLQIRRS